MENIIITVNTYPFTSFFTFLMLYVIMSQVLKVTENIFIKSKK